jgi:hypothetical protein
MTFCIFGYRGGGWGLRVRGGSGGVLCFEVSIGYERRREDKRVMREMRREKRSHHTFILFQQSSFRECSVCIAG